MRNRSALLTTALAMTGALSLCTPTPAQVAGSTTTGIQVTEVTQVAMGWSAKKSILGKNVYNEAGDKIGKVEDLIISPDKNVSYVIVGAGGFVGIGRHDVAIPVTKLQEQAGKLVMAGATRDSLKAMPAFDYASDTVRRDQLIARVDRDLAKARSQVALLQKRSAEATGEAKARIDQQSTTLQHDLQALEGRLADMKRAGVARWKEFESDLTEATTRLRKSLEQAG